MRGGTDEDVSETSRIKEVEGFEMKRELSVKSQSVETSGITKDYKEALCEYIWNGFEANATEVSLSYTPNSAGGVASVIIRDNGDGICYETVDDTFGTFLASTKAGLSLQVKPQANKGKGRFSCYAFATGAIWVTVVGSGKERMSYSIEINSENKNEYDVSDLVPVAKTTDIGTTVTITGISDLLQEDMNSDDLKAVILKTFSWFLYLNRGNGTSLILNGTNIDYKEYINSSASVTESFKIDGVKFSVTLIVWKEKIIGNFCTYYLDTDGVLHGKDTTTFNINTINFNHSVYVKSSFFNQKEGISLTAESKKPEIEAQLQMNGMESTDRLTLRKLKRKIQELISKQLNKYMVGQADKAVAGMTERGSLPTFGTDLYGQMKKQDLLKVIKAMYCVEPRIFYKMKDVQEKSFLGLLNLLLNTDERENVLSIIESIVDLTPAQREDFALVLKRTKLGNIIDTIKFIEDRYKVIEGLQHIVFDLTNYSNERDHIQKIVEQHYWLFGEQYNLVTADQRMQKSLSAYLHILYGDKAPNAVLEPDEDELRRMDIFTCGKRKYSDGSDSGMEENLIVELKAPQVKLTKTVLRQVEDYMDYIRKQPQFNSSYRTWKFVAVCKDLDDDVKSRCLAQKEKGRLGLVTTIENYEVYALTWDDIFSSFDLRHSFLLDKLKMDRESIANELTKEAEGSAPSRELVDAVTQKICATQNV